MKPGTETHVDDAHVVEVLQREDDLGDVDARPVLREHAEPREVGEQVAALHVVDHHVEAIGRLVGVVEARDEREVGALEDQAFHLRSCHLAAPHDFVLLQHLHREVLVRLRAENVKDLPVAAIRHHEMRAVPSAEQRQHLEVLEVDFAVGRNRRNDGLFDGGLDSRFDGFVLDGDGVGARGVGAHGMLAQRNVLAVRRRFESHAESSDVAGDQGPRLQQHQQQGLVVVVLTEHAQSALLAVRWAWRENVASGGDEEIGAEKHLGAHVGRRLGGALRGQFSVHTYFVNHIAALLRAEVVLLLNRAAIAHLKENQVATGGEAAPALHVAMDHAHALRDVVVCM